MPGKPLPTNLLTSLLTSSRANLARTSVPYTSSSLSLTSVLLRQGLIGSLSLGSSDGPDPTSFKTLPPSSKRLWIQLKHRNGAPVLKRLGLVSKPSKRVYLTRDELGRILTGRTAQNVKGVGMGEILIVRPTRSIHEDPTSTQASIETTESENKTSATSAWNTADQYLEGWEAWRRGLGGELVARAG